MNQHLYNDQDNQALNEQIEQAVKPVAEETEVKARGENSVINYVDELAFFKPEETAPSVKVQNSSLSGAHTFARGFTEGGIVPQGQTPMPFQFSPEQLRQAQAQVAEGGAVVLNQNGSTNVFENIKDMFSKDAPVVKKETYFVAGKAKVQYNVDRTLLEPSAVVRLSGKNFEQKYLEQLESYIYNKKENLEPTHLFEIINLVSVINAGHFPIKVVTGKHRIQLPKIVNTLNLFFNKNKSVVFGIAKMFDGITQMPQQEETKAE